MHLACSVAFNVGRLIDLLTLVRHHLNLNGPVGQMCVVGAFNKRKVCRGVCLLILASQSESKEDGVEIFFLQVSFFKKKGPLAFLLCTGNNIQYNKYK